LGVLGADNLEVLVDEDVVRPVNADAAGLGRALDPAPPDLRPPARAVLLAAEPLLYL